MSNVHAPEGWHVVELPAARVEGVNAEPFEWLREHTGGADWRSGWGVLIRTDDIVMFAIHDTQIAVMFKLKFA